MPKQLNKFTLQELLNLSLTPLYNVHVGGGTTSTVPDHYLQLLKIGERDFSNIKNILRFANNVLTVEEGGSHELGREAISKSI